MLDASLRHDISPKWNLQEAVVCPGENEKPPTIPGILGREEGGTAELDAQEELELDREFEELGTDKKGGGVL